MNALDAISDVCPSPLATSSSTLDHGRTAASPAVCVTRRYEADLTSIDAINARLRASAASPMLHSSPTRVSPGTSSLRPTLIEIGPQLAWPCPTLPRRHPSCSRLHPQVPARSGSATHGSRVAEICMPHDRGIEMACTRMPRTMWSNMGNAGRREAAIHVCVF